MKGFWKRLLCLVLVAALVVPMAFDLSNASAATNPTLNKTSKTLTGIGTTYILKVKNQPNNTTLIWSSSQPKVANVNGLGQVTAVGKGTTTITCLITYTDKSVMKLTSKITVKVPATAVKISNAKLVNNAQQMVVGESYDFNRTLTPKTSSDKTYWVIADEDIATVNSAGVVTAVKAGVTQLQARTAANKTAAMDSLNSVTDSINIIITEPVATVTSTKLTSDKVVTIQFSHAMTNTSLINVAGSLNTGNVSVEGKIVNNIKAADLGKITPSLSTDGKTLTLTATNKWDGVYIIKIENDATTQAGIMFQGYNEEFDFSDSLTPALISCNMDDTGFVALITFNKEIDISKLAVHVNDATLDITTQTILTTVSNYVLKADKKTIQLDLSTISVKDYNKPIKIYISGITDLKNNPTRPYNNEFYVITDTSTKPNASLNYVERTSKNTLTAHFSKSIQTPGFMTINNTTVYGIVDSKDKTCVNYNISSSISNTTGYLNGTVSGWVSYNSIATNNTTNFVVDMSVGASAPSLTGYDLVSTVNNNNTVVNSIVLTFSKNVVLTSTSGVLSTVYQDTNSNIIPYYLTYAATVQDNVVTIVIDPSSTIGTGIYTVNIPAYFVSDSYTNYNEAVTIQLKSSTNTGTQLPAPTSVTQDTTNPSIVIVNFAKKVDLTSAETISNYTIDTVHPVSAVVTSNSDAGATIQLTFAAGSIPVTSNYPIYIENVSGYSGTFQAMAKYTELKKLNENIAPVLQTAKLNGGTITLTFNEKIQGTAAFNVYNYGNLVAINSSQGYYIQDNMIVIVLAQSVFGTNIYVTPATGCSIKDVAGNSAFIPSQITVTQ